MCTILIRTDISLLGLWGIRFHTVVVFGLGKDLLFKFVLGRCVYLHRIGNQNKKQYV